MNIDDGRIIASLKLERRGLKKSSEYGNAMSWVDQQAWRLVELARLSSPDFPPPPASPEAMQKQMPPRDPNDDDNDAEDEEDEEDEDLEPPVVREPDE
jgi:hypothetical protein